MDLVAPGLALGIAVGRIGDLVIGDHIGTPTSFVLGWRCAGTVGGGPPAPGAEYRSALAAGSPPSLGCYDITLHQTALYDMLSTWLLLGLLLWLGTRARRGGRLALTFVLWYGTARLVTDFLRVDRRYLGLTGSQIVALAVAVAALWLLARYRGAPGPGADARYARSPAGQPGPAP